jgi:hypothetical protein
MDHVSEIPQTLSRMLYLFRVCDHHRDVEGCSELLGGVHDQLRMTLRDIEDFLQHCAASFLKDHDSAIGTPDDRALDIPDGHASDTTTTTFSDDVTAINQHLPLLTPNHVFDSPEVASGLPPIIISPTSQFFEYSRYFCETPMQHENTSGPASQAQHQENHTDLDLHEACSLDSHREIAHNQRTDDHRVEPQDHHLGKADRALNPLNSTEIYMSITRTGRATVHASSADVTEHVEDPLRRI